MLSLGPPRKDDKTACMTGNGGKPATTAALLCQLCDLYTRNDLDGKWRELTRVYEQRKNDDNLKEILDLSAPDTRLNNLTDWHLERMAVGELGGEMSSARSDVAMVKDETRRVKQILRKVLANGETFRAKREHVVNTMVKQRDVLLAELDAAKSFLEQAHTLNPGDPDVVAFTTPVPVEQRLLATVKPPEASANVDLSSAPSI